MLRPVIDVAVFGNEGVLSSSPEILAANPPLSVEVDLTEGVSIAPVFRSVGDYVIDLCSPHNLKPAPVRQFRPLYAFIRSDDAEETAYTWDPSERLQMAITLSRLAHPTSMGYEYSARLFIEGDPPDVVQAMVGPINSFGALTYVTPDPAFGRNWLTKTDAKLTRRLMEQFYASEGTRPRRLTRAIWFHEYTARTYHLDLRWVVVVQGLEALINVSDRRSRQQFRTRSVALASECGVPWSDADAVVAYGLRSRLAHGQNVEDATDHDIAVYMRMETLLRVAVRTALLDAQFRQVFSEDDLIRARWPLPPVAPGQEPPEPA